MSGEHNILFVCTGNTCRSYMAEAIARDYVSQLEPYPISLQISSAGTGCLAGEPASHEAYTVMTEMGLADKEHQATPLTSELIKEAKLVLTMTRSQRQYILSIVPEAGNKVYLLAEYALAATGQAGEATQDISDPFGAEITVYRTCARQLAELVPLAIDRYLTEQSAGPNKMS